MERQPVSLFSSLERQPQVIFLLNEDEGLRAMLMDALSVQNRQIVTFSREDKLLQYCQTFSPELFIINYELSKRNGLELLHQLRTNVEFEIIPCILINAPVSVELQASLHIWNLQEPFDLDALLACVEDALKAGTSLRLFLRQFLIEKEVVTTPHA